MPTKIQQIVSRHSRKPNCIFVDEASTSKVKHERPINSPLVPYDDSDSDEAEHRERTLKPPSFTRADQESSSFYSGGQQSRSGFGG